VQVREIAIELKTVGAASWVDATADGKTAFSQNLRPGVTLRFEASRRFDVRLGNAEAARLVVNGRTIELGPAAGRVLTLRVTLTDGHVTVRNANGDLIVRF
jgi:hypothetical protein